MTSWPSIALGEIFNIARGGSPRPIDAFITDAPDGVNWIMIGDAPEGTKFIRTTKKRIKPSGVSRSRIVKPGDFLLTNSMSFGRPYIVKTNGCIHDGWLVLSPTNVEVSSDYFYHLLGSKQVYAEFARLAAGATVKNLNIDIVSGVRVPVPPLGEQRRIAAILDQAEELRAKRRVVVEQTDALEQAIFEQQVGQANIWPESAIGDLARSIRTGPFGSQLLHSEFVDVGVAVLGIDNAVRNTFAWGEQRFITETKYRNLSRFRVYPRDVIVTIMGTCGRAAVVPDDIPLAITTKHLCSITLDESVCLPEFLHACLLRHPAVLKQLGVTARGAVMPGLNMGLIKATVIPLPPLSVQKEFAKRQCEIAVNRNRFEKSKGMLDSLFASIQYRAFRGEL